MVRDNLTSFTQNKFVNQETKQELKERLVSILFRIKPNMLVKVRVDPHSSFQSLVNDKELKNMNIHLVIGHEKNVNKNGTAEKAIQELQEELTKLDTSQNLTEIDLAKAKSDTTKERQKNYG